MKNMILLIAVFSLISLPTLAQFQIGHTTITFNDATRSGGFGSGGGPGRQIQTEIYYPALVTGEDVAIAPLNHPIIVFGHGFAMSWNAYENIWAHYAALGYIVAFPRTESGLFPAPSHYDFALDLAIVESKLQALNFVFGSLFYLSIKPNSAIIGHSMGGGATILTGNVMSGSVKTIIGFAPAETDPSAIDSAVNVLVPALIFSGSQDGVTPPVNHHLPIYNALGSDCKTFVSINGGAHCYFANTNFNCDFGESTSSTGITITREEQQDKTYQLLSPWLDFYLNENCDAFLAFEDSLSNVSGITFQRTCNYTPLNVVANLTHINLGSDGAIDVTITGGLNPIDFSWSNFSLTLDQTNLNEGFYGLVVSDSFCTITNEYQILGPASIDSYENVAVQIFPNPSNGKFSIQFESLAGEPTLIEIFDLQGSVIYTNSYSSHEGINQLTIDLSTVANSIYILKMNQVPLGKIVLE